MNATIKAAAFAVFNDADNLSASCTDRLLSLGFADRATAKPVAMEWAAAKYKAKIEQGQRGAKLPRDSAAERAMNRVLAICFPAADAPKAARQHAPQDAVERALKAYAKLTGPEKRSFKLALAKL